MLMHLEDAELCGLYIQHINTFMQYAGCKPISIEAIKNKKVGKLDKK